MAVSLTRLSNEATKRQSMAYYSAAAISTPLSEHFQQPFPRDYSNQQSYSCTPYAPQPLPSHQSFARPAYHYQQPPLPVYHDQPPPVPPRPLKSPIESQRPHVASTASTIVPDPLPPHSNPQALTKSQSTAFEDSEPIPPVRIGKEEAWIPQTGFALFVITRGKGHGPPFVFSKPSITVTRIDGNRMGTIRFHTVTTNSIDISVNGRNTRISNYGLIHNRCGFLSMTSQRPAEEMWYWTKDKTTKGAKLVDAKKNGRVLARMKGDLLTFEKGRLSDASYDEVLLSAVAMAEAARRAKRNGDVIDLASAIGDFASPDSGGDGDGGGA